MATLFFYLGTCFPLGLVMALCEPSDKRRFGCVSCIYGHLSNMYTTRAIPGRTNANMCWWPTYVEVGVHIKQLFLPFHFHCCCCCLQNLQVATDPIVNKPKPKVEPPKDEQQSSAGSEETVGSEETRMEDDSKPPKSNPDKQPPPSSEDMDLD